jgi:hypothetical protein
MEIKSAGKVDSGKKVLGGLREEACWSLLKTQGDPISLFWCPVAYATPALNERNEPASLP